MKLSPPEVTLPVKSSFLVGARVYLRPLERTDLNERYLNWLNDSEVSRYLESGVFPATLEDLEKFYREVTASRSQVIFAIVDTDSGQHIGNVKLGPISWVHRQASFGILIGDKKFWAKGVATESARLAVEYGFYRLNLHRIDLGVFSEHESAVACYKKVGFQVEGCFREDLFLDGEYKDRLWMGLLRSEYTRLKMDKGK